MKLKLRLRQYKSGPNEVFLKYSDNWLRVIK